MGKKKPRRNNNQHNKTFIAPYSPVQNPPVVKEDEIGEELAEVQRENLAPPMAAPRKSLSALNLDYDEFDRADVEIPLNNVITEPDRANLKAPKHAYQTVYMSHENVTSPVPRTPLNRTESIHSNKSAFGVSSSKLSTARSASVSSNYNKLADGGAYEDFRASHQSLNNRNQNDGGGDNSFLSDATGERSLAGFPTSAFGGSRASIRKEDHSDDEIQIVREIPSIKYNVGELERLNVPEVNERRSRLSSRSSVMFGFDNMVVNSSPQNQKNGKSPSKRSRTVSQNSRQSGPSSNHVLKTSTSQQLTDELPEDVRTYHADSEYLQNRLSKLSIHTNNDEFVLVGGHPPELGNRSNVPSVGIHDDFTFRSEKSNTRGNESVFSRLSQSNRSKSMSRENVSSSSQNENNIYSSNRELDQGEEVFGRSISQTQLSDRSAINSRASSRNTIGTTSNTDDRLLLAAKYSRLPEAEGLVQIPNSQPTTSNVRTIVGTKPSMSRTSSVCSNKSERVNFAEIPTLFSHPDDNFGNDQESDNEGEPFRSTKEHQFTPSNKSESKSTIRNKIQALEDREPEKALYVTSALTPVAKRAPISSKTSVSDSVLQTPQTVIRNQESRCIRKIVEPLRTKTTAEIAIQTGNTIRLRQGKWNPDILSEFANPTLPESPNRPKMNNSFERNGHPAVSVLSNMLRNRVNSPKATPVSSDTDVTTVRSSESNSSHQVTMVHQSDSQNTVLGERLRHISDRYNNEDSEKTKFVPLSSSTPLNCAEKQRRNGISSIECLQEQALQKTGSEKSIHSMADHLATLTNENESVPIKIDARWMEEKRSSGDTIRKHVPRGRIRDLAQAFDTMQINSPKQELPVPNYRGNYWRASEEYSKETSCKYPSGDRLHSSSDTRSRSSSNRLDGSTMSSNIFLPHSSSHNINDRHRSTSSSLSYQPNVFTRNTFVRTSTTATSNIKPGVIPTNVPMATMSGNGQGDINENNFGGFVSQFERIPSIRNLASNNPHNARNMKYDDVGHTDSDNVIDKFKDGSVLKRSMPSRESFGKKTGDTPILRRQTAVIEIPKNVEKMRNGSVLRRQTALIEIPKNSEETDDTSSIRKQTTMRDIPRISGDSIHVPIQRLSNQDTDEYRKMSTNVEVPISRVTNPSKMHRLERAKTQEVNTSQYYQPHSLTVYDTRAASGEIRKSIVNLEESFRTGRDLYGRQTTEDLSSIRYDGKQIFEDRLRKTEEFGYQNEVINDNDRKARPLEVSPRIAKHAIGTLDQHPSKFNVPTNLTRHSTTTRDNITYSPPATEDAGSRVTHLTQSLQDGSTDRILTAEEDSSTIRGKIDRMFDFVDENEKVRIEAGEEASTISSGTLGGRERSSRLVGGRFEKNFDIYSPNTKFTSYVPVSRQRISDEHGEWERTIYNEKRTSSEAKIPEATEKYRRRVANSPPDRRNTVATGGGTATDSDFEYSLSQYREMQREQLFRRLPSVDEPQFFRSPALSAPHAGQSINAYRSKDLCGTPTAGEKIRLNPSFSNGLSTRVVPIALATSTPMDSPTSMSPSYRKREVNNNTFEGIGGPHDTFVSSISGVSTNEKQVDYMKRINRLSYMIENTQKQMSMNEAVLADAIKKGKQAQEIAANRSILISREALRLQRRELRRLHAFSAVRRPPPPIARNLKGSVIFSNVTVQLNKNFCSRLTPADHNSYVFVALFKCGYQVDATEYVSLIVEKNTEIMDKLMFVKPIQFSDVPVDFTVHVEFYAMKMQPQKQVEHTSFATRCKNLMGPPQKKVSNSTSNSETAFKIRGHIGLDRDASNVRCFLVDDVTYPLEGTVMIDTKCTRLPDVFEEDFKGFLTIFSTISNMASWDRYWAVLRRGIVFLWKYPDEEQQGKEPRMQIDLTKCTNNEIEKCAFDVCPRPFSFMIEILVESADNQIDQSVIGSVVEKKRVLLSADTAEMLSKWLCLMNQTLDVIRGPI